MSAQKTTYGTLSVDFGQKKAFLPEYANQQELTNHIGNVLAVVSDRKIAVDDGQGNVDYYEADIVSAQDYYPFGMIQPGRSVSAGEYRYGFGGQEMDNEFKGTGNSINYTLRMYDTRLGRFFSPDPYEIEYPSLSTYSFVGNSPISNIEVDGGWWFSKNAQNKTTRTNSGVTFEVQGASEYAYRMSNVRSVANKQGSYASYIPIVGNVMNASAMIDKLQDPTMKIDADDVLSIVLGGYFKAIRKTIKSAGGLVGAGKTALDVSERFSKLTASIATSPELTESWVELSVMEHFAGMKSEAGNEIGFLRGDGMRGNENRSEITFHFGEDFISELKGTYGKEYDNLNNNSDVNRDDFINQRVGGHLQSMFENKKSEIMNELGE